jgi:hypothetical protein
MVTHNFENRILGWETQHDTNAAFNSFLDFILAGFHMPVICSLTWKA